MHQFGKMEGTAMPLIALNSWTKITFKINFRANLATFKTGARCLSTLLKFGTLPSFKNKPVPSSNSVTPLQISTSSTAVKSQRTNNNVATSSRSYPSPWFCSFSCLVSCTWTTSIMFNLWVSLTGMWKPSPPATTQLNLISIIQLMKNGKISILIRLIPWVRMLSLNCSFKTIWKMW